MKTSKMGIKKYHLWLLFFLVIFGFTFGMIIWTVKSAVNTPVYEDKSFMSAYHDVDDNFNEIMFKNTKFNSLYKVEVNVNNRIVGLEIKDAFLGQRSLEKQSKNQEMLIVGENKISLLINERKSNQFVMDANVSFQITRPIEDMYDINLNDFKIEGNAYQTTAKIEKAGNWNILAKITIGDDIGYLYIKTSTKK